MMEKQELIWVEKEFAEKWKELTDAKATREQQIAVFTEYMDFLNAEVRRDFKVSLEALDEDAAIFAGLMLKVKQAFGKAKDEHLTASYELWEKFEAEIPSVSGKIDSLLKTLRPLKDELTEINNLIGKINTHDIDRMNQSVSLLAGTYGKHKEMVEFLVNHFGAKDSQ